MLILTRKPGESIYIGDKIKITLVELKGNQIRVGVDAPKELKIYREEIYLQILEENKQAAAGPEIKGELDGLAAAWGNKEGFNKKGVGNLSKLSATTTKIETKKSGGKDSDE